MQKQELVHLHALLLEVRVHLEEADTISPEAFGAYDAQVIRPHHIFRGKAVHRNAITLLLDGFDQSIPAVVPPLEVSN